MIPNSSDEPNWNLSKMHVAGNGTHYTNLHTTESGAPASPRYRAILAGMEAWEIWEDLSDQQRLQVIFSHFAPGQWFDEQALAVLVAVWRDAALRGRIKAEFKAIGGSPWDLANAVEALLPGGWNTSQQGAVFGQAAWLGADDRPRFKTITARELFTMVIPPQLWIVQDVLPAGATLYVGKSKDGKSMMAWNMCMAVATGGTALGRYPVHQGHVLYLALEDGERRAQKRLKEQMALTNMDVAPEHLEIVPWDVPRMGEGFEAALLTWLDDHLSATLVVVDILEKIRPRRIRNGSVYADDYAAIAPLQRIAQERNVAVLIVHHSNKTKPEDFRDSASGSMGLVGACDTFWGLKRMAGDNNAALKIIGRDVETQDLALRFEAGFWTVLGDVETVNMNAAHQAILDALADAGCALTPTMLATLHDANINTMKSHLRRLEQRGLVLKVGTGHYIPRVPPGPSGS